eukprot:10024122-Heterocapsa_arctica.AAC.1
MPLAHVRGVSHLALLMRLLPAAPIVHRPLISCSCSTLSSNLLALVIALIVVTSTVALEFVADVDEHDGDYLAPGRSALSSR